MVDNLLVDPDIPIGAGVRVIEINSPRFVKGSAKIQPDHIAQLDRVVAVMQALPNVSLLEGRAPAAVHYLTGLLIAGRDPGAARPPAR